MDKKSKELMRKHKKVRPASSSESSSSSDSDSGSSDSYSSSSSDKKTVHRKGKKVRPRRSSSSSDDERTRKREKHACHRKLEAKKNHLKRKLKEAKAAKKRGISPSMRRRSVSPHKLKKIPIPGSSAEKKHHQMILKERLLKEKEREREKIRLNRERMAAAGRPIGKEPKSRSPSKAIRCREVKQQHKSPGNLEQPPERHHHQISPREKIIIQTRRDRSPSERTKGPKDIRHRLDDRRERERAEAARQKEREEALARCQERQRERERIAREKQMRRDKEFDRDRLLPRPAEREMALAAARAGNSRDRSVEPPDIRRPGHSHGHSSRQGGRNEIDYERENYDRERMYAGRSLEREDRRGGSISGDIDREYLVVRHRDISSPAGQSGHYSDRQRGSDREIYPDEERYEHHENYAATQQQRHSRSGYIPPPNDEPSAPHHRRGERGPANWDQPGHREREPRSIDRDWKSNKEDWDNQHWDETNWQQKPPQQHSRKKPALAIPQPEENWDEDEGYSKIPPTKKAKVDWNDPTLGVVGAVGGRIKHDHPREDHAALLPGPHDAPPHPVPHQPHLGRRWPQQEWRPRGPAGQIHVPGGPAPVNFRHNAPIHAHPMDYTHERPDYRRQPHHFPAHLPHHHPVGYHHPPRPHFPSKRQMTYTNPNLLQNQKAAQQARLAAAAAAAAAAQLNSSLTVASTIVTTATTVSTPAIVIATQSNLTSKVQTTLTKPSTITTTTPTISTAQSTTVSETSASVTGTSTPKGTENILEKNSDNSSTETNDDSKKLESGEIAEESSGDGVTDSGTVGEEVIPDDLSEISDEADDILNKGEELAKNSAKLKMEIGASSEKSQEIVIKNEVATTENNSVVVTGTGTGVDTQITGDSTDKDINDDLLDFEEISDGELEEESRKNLGDALGVDWSSLVRDTKVQTGQPSEEQYTTAKQKWQPHRVILDIGISFKFAGEEFAKRILNDAKQKLNEEQQAIKSKIENKINTNEDDVKSELKIKLEAEDVEEFGEISTTANNVPEIKNEKNDCVTEETLDDSKEDDENISGIACVQVANRRSKEIRKNLIFNACGPNSRALSASSDLNLRRQLCGLPVTQIDRPRKVSEKLKVLAIQAFQKAAAVGEVQ